MKPTGHLKELPWCEFDEVEVEIRVLDSINIPRIDFAHIDVQGAEMAVLRGGRKIFQTTRAIWLEVANIPLYENQPLKKDISQYLSLEGFRLAHDTARHLKYGDMLWVRR